MPEDLDTLPSPGQRATDVDSGERRCLEVDELLAFAQGRLSGAELREAHAHLDSCGVCQRLLNEAAHALTTTPALPPEEGDWNTMFLPNSVLGQRYRIERFIARGGMGEVYEAFDCELGERVALKTVASTSCDSPRAVRRLKAEVQLARRVSHRNVCRIYDLGAHVLESSGALINFLTMEFVEGETLGQRIRTHGALAVDQAQALVRQLLLGLSAAHDAGILHRDFKSDNVMLRTEADGALTPLILDFGLARSLDGEQLRHTSGQNQALVGTLSYMAPEQVEGKSLSAASDVYALGVVWFEMLTGKLPFGADSAAVSALERLRKTPAAPSTLNPVVPKALDAVVLRCLSRSAADRFHSADEVLAAIDSLPPSLSVPTKNRQFRRAALILIVVGVGAAVFGTLVLARRPAARSSTEVAAAATELPSAPKATDLPSKPALSLDPVALGSTSPTLRPVADAGSAASTIAPARRRPSESGRVESAGRLAPPNAPPTPVPVTRRSTEAPTAPSSTAALGFAAPAGLPPANSSRKWWERPLPKKSEQRNATP